MGSSRIAYLNNSLTSSRKPNIEFEKSSLNKQSTVNMQPHLQLQQAVGNQAVQSLFRLHKIQTKLSISNPSDISELEAERVAKQIMQKSEFTGAPVPNLSTRNVDDEDKIQRKCKSCEDEEENLKINRKISSYDTYYSGMEEDIIGEINAVRRDEGSPIDRSTRAFMESRFGYDFGNVRIHSNDRAVASTKKLNSLAYTIGKDIIFGQGSYNPSTNEGKHLLAHELVHVLQQSPARTQFKRSMGSDYVSSNSIISSDTGSISVSKIRSIISRIPLDDGGIGSISGGEASVPRTNRELIDSALSSGSAADVKLITNFSESSADEKFKLINILLNQRWIGPFDEYALEQIWNSFGTRLPQEASANIELWKECINRGAELDDLAEVGRIKSYFALDVKQLAIDYLFINRDYILEEISTLGLTETRGKTAPQEEQQRELADVQNAAAKVELAQQAQRDLLRTQVGYDWENYDMPGGGFRSKLEPATFNPDMKPQIGPKGNEVPPIQSWDKVKEQFDLVTALISGIANKYPSVFALMSHGRVGEVAKATPEQARVIILKAFKDTLNKIEEAVPKIESEDLDWRDLRPIHEQLMSGTPATSDTDWSLPFNKWIIEDILSDYEAKEFWISLGLGTLAAAAFVVAELATAGSATFLIAAGIGLTATGLQVGMSWEHYLDLAQAAETHVKPELAILSQGAASAALLQAVLDTAFAFLDLYGPAAKGVTSARRSLARQALEVGEREIGKTAAQELAEAAEKKTAAQIERSGSELIAEAQAELAIGSASHTMKGVRNGTRLELWLCTTCRRVTALLSEIIPNIPISGETQSLARRLAKLNDRTIELELRFMRGEVEFSKLPAELNQIAAHLRDLSNKYPDVEALLFFRRFRAAADWDLLAERLGYQKIKGKSHGQPIYFNGQYYISPDVAVKGGGSHAGGVWKMADSVENLGKKETRMGTYDEALKRIGD